MLESLCQGVGTIHELHLEGAFPARAPYQPREVYEALKQTPLFDAERGQWNWYMSAEQELRFATRYAYAQLLGVLVEAQFSSERASALCDTLKATPLYDPARSQWNLMMSEEQQLESSDRFVVSQLLGVLVDAQFNRETARVLHERLKTTPLYDPQRGQWNFVMTEAQILRSHQRNADVQLLGVVVEALFHPEGARVRYEALKATPLYDAARRQWNLLMSTEQHLYSSERHADCQLLGVLAEAQFDPERARELYEELRASPLYDFERGQWNWSMSEQQILRDATRNTDAQLLGVLVEATLLSISRRPLTEAVPPLPIMEDW